MSPARSVTQHYLRKNPHSGSSAGKLDLRDSPIIRLKVWWAGRRETDFLRHLGRLYRTRVLAFQFEGCAGVRMAGNGWCMQSTHQDHAQSICSKANLHSSLLNAGKQTITFKPLKSERTRHSQSILKGFVAWSSRSLVGPWRSVRSLRDRVPCFFVHSVENQKRV